MIKVHRILKILPRPIEDFAGKCALRIYKKIAEKRIVKQYINDEDIEKKEIARFIKKHGMQVLNYDFDISKTDWRNIKVYRDEDGFPYVLHKGKRLYYKKGANDKTVALAYIEILQEQDARSPHCYVQNERRKPSEGCIIAEVGAAGASFTLDWIDICKKAYLFECAEEWIEALKKTFAPWSDKVTIINKYVGSETNNKEVVRLDDFFKNDEISVIKADIEGAELEMLEGAKQTLSEKVSQLYICTYHRWNHEEEINKQLEELGFDTEFNRGYMLTYRSPSDFEKNVFRRGVIYAKK